MVSWRTGVRRQHRLFHREKARLGSGEGVNYLSTLTVWGNRFAVRDSHGAFRRFASLSAWLAWRGLDAFPRTSRVRMVSTKQGDTTRVSADLLVRLTVRLVTGSH